MRHTPPSPPSETPPRYNSAGGSLGHEQKKKKALTRKGKAWAGGEGRAGHKRLKAKKTTLTFLSGGASQKKRTILVARPPAHPPASYFSASSATTRFLFPRYPRVFPQSTRYIPHPSTIKIGRVSTPHYIAAFPPTRLPIPSHPIPYQYLPSKGRVYFVAFALHLVSQLEPYSWVSLLPSSFRFFGICPPPSRPRKLTASPWMSDTPTMAGPSPVETSAKI